ncbi:DUF2325 domain-containing protein [Staphylococcus delphini]|uniref:DUF2325 domain-containing protein n=1 Tax=Staphylococcus delphini TaxID=53344 RepID=UPI001362636C|nr:DUF2325 domain-containing protein [Staphylococcus delphini]NBK46739.1 DUF2325 domain-containing protein [Staphylococcus delphini]
MNDNFKNELMQTIKQAWIKDIEQLHSVDEISEQSHHYLEMLKHLNALTIVNNNESKQSIARMNDEKEEHSQSDELDNVYILSRNLRGGIGLKENNDKDTVYVPENIIRSENLEHGDYFAYEKNGLSIGRDSFIKIETLPKGSIEEKEITSYDYAVIAFDDILQSYICNEYYNDGVLTKLTTILIHDEDVAKFKLEVGDLVTIAHMPDKSIARVRWKYSLNEAIPTPTSKKPTYYKQNTQGKDEDEVDKEEFLGIYVGVLGAEKFNNGYTEEVNKRGGTIFYTDSDVSSTVESVINKSDIVLIPIFNTSHAKALIAKKLAKKNNKPFIILKSNGRNTFVNEIRAQLEKMRKESE